MEMVTIGLGVVEVVYPLYSKYRGEQRFRKIEKRIKVLEQVSIDLHNSDELELRLVVEKYVKDFYCLDEEIVQLLLDMCKLSVSTEEKKILYLLLSVPSKTLNRVYREISSHIYQNSKLGTLFILPKCRVKDGNILIDEFFLEQDEKNDLQNAGLIKPYASGMTYGYPSASAFSFTSYGFKMLDIFNIQYLVDNKFFEIPSNILDVYHAGQFEQIEEIDMLVNEGRKIREELGYLRTLGHHIQSGTLCIPVCNEQKYIEIFEKLYALFKMENEKKFTISKDVFSGPNRYTEKVQHIIQKAIDNRMVFSYQEAHSLNSADFEKIVMNHERSNMGQDV